LESKTAGKQAIYRRPLAKLPPMAQNSGSHFVPDCREEGNPAVRFFFSRKKSNYHEFNHC
jgi:hypothetical protein